MEKISTKEINKEGMKVILYHISSFDDLKNAKIGDNFLFVPGPQGAEGKGIYFSQDKPRPSAAEGTFKKGVSGIIVIEANSATGWWRTKGHIMRKFNRPRTWHSDKKDILLTVKEIRKEEGLPYNFIVCDWEFKK
jgi:hypothetical protein